MSEAYRRKKQPELVRQQLLDAGIEILAQQGSRTLTLDAVASKAGITKGGLIHHFPNREALLIGIFDFLLQEFDSGLRQYIQSDPEPKGRFTRAYLRTMLGCSRKNLCGSGVPIYLAVMADPLLRSKMESWFKDQYRSFIQHETSIELEIVRFAVDGLWFSEALGENRMSPQEMERIVSRLIDMTYQY